MERVAGVRGDAAEGDVWNGVSARRKTKRDMQRRLAQRRRGAERKNDREMQRRLTQRRREKHRREKQNSL